jgi:hypothetical protein
MYEVYLFNMNQLLTAFFCKGVSACVRFRVQFYEWFAHEGLIVLNNYQTPIYIALQRFVSQ